MVVDPSANLVYTTPSESNYLLAYDGATGRLVNLHVFENPIGPVAFNPNSNEVYVHTGNGEQHFDWSTREPIWLP